MRFVMISLLIDCLLFFGISYLTFGDTEIVPIYERRTHQSGPCIDDVACKMPFETSKKFCIITPEVRCVVCQCIIEREIGTASVSEIQ